MTDKNMLELLPKLTRWQQAWVRWAVAEMKCPKIDWHRLPLSDSRILLCRRLAIANQIERVFGNTTSPRRDKNAAQNEEIRQLLQWLRGRDEDE